MKTQASMKITIGAVIFMLSISAVFILFGYKQERLNDAFLDAAFKGDYEKVVALLEQGASIRARQRRFYNRNTAIHLAAWQGHLDIVKLLLEKGLSIEEKDSDKNTPLIMALRYEKLAEDDEIIRFLIVKGSNLNHKNRWKENSMHVIAGRCDSNKLIKSAELMIDADVDLNALDYWGKTPMQQALQREQYQMVEFLVIKGAKMTMDVACALGNVGDVKKLIQEGEDPYIEDCGSVEALNWAAKLGRTEVVRFLLENYNKAHNQKKNIGITPLVSALTYTIEGGHVDLFLYLVEAIKKADIHNKVNYTWWLLSAVETGKIEIVKVLLDNGADINAHFPGNLIRTAISNNSEEILSLLLSSGVNPNEEIDAVHQTPLHVCAANNRWKLIPILVEHGAGIDAKNGIGDTPIDIASKCGSLDAVNELVKAGAKINLLNAVRIGDTEKIREFLQHGANINTGDNGGYAPIHLAVMSEKKDMVELLLSEGADPNLFTADNLTALDIAEGRFYMGYMHKESMKRMEEIATLLRKHGAKRYRFLKRSK